jgi:hypothetical protein
MIPISPNTFAAKWPGVFDFNLDFIKIRYEKYTEQQKCLIDIINRLKGGFLKEKKEEYKGHEASNENRYKIKF